MSGSRPYGRRDPDLLSLEDHGECGAHSLVSNLPVGVCSDVHEITSCREGQAEVFHHSELYVNYGKLLHSKPSSLCSLPLGTVSDQPGRENYSSLQVCPKTNEFSQAFRCVSSSQYQQRHDACGKKAISPLHLDQQGSHGRWCSSDTRDCKRKEMMEFLDFSEADDPPARLPAISGVLTEKLGRPLVRPVAFRPIHGSAACVVSPSLSVNSMADSGENLHCPDGCSQQSWLSWVPASCAPPSYSLGCHSLAALKKSSEISLPRSSGISSECSNHEGVAEISTSSSALGVLSGQGRHHAGSFLGSGAQHSHEVSVQTPSPSDSGVGELEAMLKEKDAEIQTLRQVMDNNERAILQVYEEKRSVWLHDVREIHQEYEEKLKAQQSKAYKAEQSLCLQLSRLQQEKQQMQGEIDSLRSEKEALLRQCAIFQHQLHDVRLQLEAASVITTSPTSPALSSVDDSATFWKNLSEPHTGMASCTTAAVDQTRELEYMERRLAGVRSKQSPTLFVHGSTSEAKIKPKTLRISSVELKDINVAESSQENENDSSLGRICVEKFTQTDHNDEGAYGSPRGDKQMAMYLAETDKLQKHLQAAEETLELERRRWLEEKNKVIRYQKQLQLNYVQMQRKNTALEAEVEQLTLELERRDLKLIAMNGEESVC